HPCGFLGSWSGTLGITRNPREPMHEGVNLLHMAILKPEWEHRRTWRPRQRRTPLGRKNELPSTNKVMRIHPQHPIRELQRCHDDRMIPLIIGRDYTIAPEHEDCFWIGVRYHPIVQFAKAKRPIAGNQQRWNAPLVQRHSYIVSRPIIVVHCDDILDLMPTTLGLL